jgi:hypothetical protein
MYQVFKPYSKMPSLSVRWLCTGAGWQQVIHQPVGTVIAL